LTPGQTPPKEWPKYPKPVDVKEFGGANPDMSLGDGSKLLGEIKTAKANKQLNEQALKTELTRRKDVETYLNQYPPEKREGVKTYLQSLGFIDAKGNPKGDWDHEKFAKTFYEIPKGGEIPQDLSSLKPIAFNNGENFDPNVSENKGPLGEMQKALKETPPNFAGAKAALDKADPLTKSIGNQMLRDAYVGSIDDILMKSESEHGYGFKDPDDRKAIKVARGLLNPDGSPKTDLSPDNAEASFRELGGFDPEGKSAVRPTKNQIKMETVKYYREKLPGEMARMGMNGDDVAKKMASKGYFDDADTFPPGRLGEMQKDYEAALGTKGDPEKTKTLALQWKNDGKNTVQPSGIAGARYQATRSDVNQMYQPGGPGSKPDPTLESARQQIYGADQQQKTLDQGQQKIDIEKQQLEFQKDKDAKDRVLAYDQLKQKTENDNAYLEFQKDKAEKDRQLQKVQMQMHLIETMIQFMGQLFSSALQILGQTSAAHISGQYQVQAAIMQKFKNS